MGLPSPFSSGQEENLLVRSNQSTRTFFGRALFLSAAISITLPAAWAQSPADGQTPGAAINTTPGTSTLPNPADQLGNMGGVNNVQQTAIDKIFLKKAIQGNLAEVRLGELTLQKSTNDQVKQFAHKMIEDHTKLNEQLRPAAFQLSVDIPSDVSKKDKSLISKMESLSGDAYDQAYIKDMVRDHKQDLNEFRMAASNGHNPELKDAAAKGSQMIVEHLQMAEQLAKDRNVDLAKK